MKHPRVLVGSVFAGLAVMVLLVVLIFEVGRRDPSPPSLQDRPNTTIPGEIVYLATNGCVTQIDASGAGKREIVCQGRADFVVRLDERTIVYGGYGPAGISATQRDLATGLELDYPAPAVFEKFIPGVSIERQSVRGESISIDPDGSVYRTGGGEPGRVRIFDCDCPRHQTPEFATWSPDGEWLMLTYWNSRAGNREIWIMARTGTPAGTLATANANASASWFIAGEGVLPKTTLTPLAR